MIIARCPHCETTFRATPDALKARHGKVRCGQCNKAFNALDHLIEENTEDTPVAPSPPRPIPAAPSFTLVSPPGAAGPATGKNEPPAASERPAAPREPAEPVAPAPSAPSAPIAPGLASAPAEAPAMPPAASRDPLGEAQSAGLVAARETRDVPGYSKWAEGTFMASGAAFDEPKRTHWFSVLIAVLLTLMLLIQGVYLYRSEIASRWPDARPWLEEACRNLDCRVPYPSQADLIDIQASELQIDPARGGLLVLYLTVQNRAEYAQAYPSIELTLTDLREQVVVRRLLTPADWLPPKLEHPEAFAGNAEVAARLWIDPQDTGAVGYSLKVVYP